MATGPQANGQGERINRILIPMLGKLSDESMGKSWHGVLSEIEYAVNNSVGKIIGYVLSQLLFGVSRRENLLTILKNI